MHIAGVDSKDARCNCLVFLRRFKTQLIPGSPKCYCSGYLKTIPIWMELLSTTRKGNMSTAVTCCYTGTQGIPFPFRTCQIQKAKLRYCGSAGAKMVNLRCCESSERILTILARWGNTRKRIGGKWKTHYKLLNRCPGLLPFLGELKRGFQV